MYSSGNTISAGSVPPYSAIWSTVHPTAAAAQRTTDA